MSITSPAEAASADAVTTLDTPLSKLNELLERMYPKGRLRNERRQEMRYPFPYLIPLYPVESDGISPAGDSFTVIGKHISENGIGFYHTEAMPYRYVVASLSDDESDDVVHMLLDLTWCRFSKKGWYENGGWMLREMDEPVLASRDEAAVG